MIFDSKKSAGFSSLAFRMKETEASNSLFVAANSDVRSATCSSSCPAWRDNCACVRCNASSICLRSLNSFCRRASSHHGWIERYWLGHSQALRGRRCARCDHWATRERVEGGGSLHQEKPYDARGRRVALGRSGPALCRREREAWSHRCTLRQRGRGYRSEEHTSEL